MTSIKTSKNICIIGAGPCGLTSAKNLLEQGIDRFEVFEKNTCLGGNWVFDETSTHSSIYETTHIISSKKLSQFEDFPMPADYPDYPSHAQILRYLNDYAEHFGIKKHIRLNTSVENICRNDAGEWLVTWQDKTGIHQQRYDQLFIANGHHWDPVMPQYPGHFEGDILHAHQYKRALPFKNKRVLVVGGGNSACDLAVEIARVAKKTMISMRQGQHIFPKFIFGKPTDIAFAKIHWLPVFMKQALAKTVIRILQGRYAKYQLKKPLNKPLTVHPTINSELLYFIRHGRVIPQVGIERLEGNTVYFKDGRQEDFDVIIFATGYKISFPFFKDIAMDFSELAHIPLYKKMLHPKFDNLYFIGLFQPQGCIWPLADYQAKIAAGIIHGSLIPPANLNHKVEEEIKASKKRFAPNARHALEVDYQDFRQELLRELKDGSRRKKKSLDACCN